MDANADSFRTMIKPLTVLLVASGAARGTQIAVPPGGLVLGRDGPPQGRLGDDPVLSRRHAVITHSGRGELVVSDLGSANGTFLNGSRVEDSAPVRPGDIIELGSSRLQATGSAPGGAQTLTTPASPAHPGAAQAAPPPARPPAPGWPYAQAPGQQYPPPGQPFTSAPPAPAVHSYNRYPAAAVPPGMHYDQVSGLVLPQGTQLATAGRRIGAYFLAIPLWIITLVIGYLSIIDVARIITLVIGTLGIGYLIWGLIAWGNGQTPALQVLGMRCWRPETRQVAGWGTMALREIIGRLLESLFFPIIALVSFFIFLTGKEHKSLHDHVAGTVVLHDPGKVLSRWRAAVTQLP